MGSSTKNGHVTVVDVPGAVSTSLFDLNNRGEIVGLYQDGAQAGGYHAFVATPKQDYRGATGGGSCIAQRLVSYASLETIEP